MFLPLGFGTTDVRTETLPTGYVAQPRFLLHAAQGSGVSAQANLAWRIDRFGRCICFLCFGFPWSLKASQLASPMQPGVIEAHNADTCEPRVDTEHMTYAGGNQHN